MIFGFANVTDTILASATTQSAIQLSSQAVTTTRSNFLSAFPRAWSFTHALGFELSVSAVKRPHSEFGGSSQRWWDSAQRDKVSQATCL